MWGVRSLAFKLERRSYSPSTDGYRAPRPGVVFFLWGVGGGCGPGIMPSYISPIRSLFRQPLSGGEFKAFTAMRHKLRALWDGGSWAEGSRRYAGVSSGQRAWQTAWEIARISGISVVPAWLILPCHHSLNQHSTSAGYVWSLIHLTRAGVTRAPASFQRRDQFQPAIDKCDPLPSTFASIPFPPGLCVIAACPECEWLLAPASNGYWETWPPVLLRGAPSINLAGPAQTYNKVYGWTHAFSPANYREGFPRLICMLFIPYNTRPGEDHGRAIAPWKMIVSPIDLCWDVIVWTRPVLINRLRQITISVNYS